MLLSLPMLLPAPMLLQVFLLLLALLFLALLHYECCSMMSLLLLFFSAPMRKNSYGLFRSLERDLLHSQIPEKSSGPRNATFCIPQCRKIVVPGARPGLQAWKMSHSGDQKTFPAFGNAKGLLAGTRRVFLHGGM
jgi:hypothetical protein